MSTYCGERFGTGDRIRCGLMPGHAGACIGPMTSSTPSYAPPCAKCADLERLLAAAEERGEQLADIERLRDAVEDWNATDEDQAHSDDIADCSVCYVVNRFIDYLGDGASRNRGGTMSKTITVYVGYVDGRPAREPFWNYDISYIPVFTSKRAASKAFEDVRRATLVISDEPAPRGRSD